MRSNGRSFCARSMLRASDAKHADEFPGKPTMLVVPATHPDAKPSATRWRVLARRDASPGLPDGHALLEIDLESGRQHQIRVHLASIGHPLLADNRYGAPGPVELAPGRVLERVALHAARLEIRHPRDGEPRVFTAALPLDLRHP